MHFGKFLVNEYYYYYYSSLLFQQTSSATLISLSMLFKAFMAQTVNEFFFRNAFYA
jgi:hypothetical protein